MSRLTFLIAVAVIATAWSLIQTADYAVWFFELGLGALGVGLLAFTHHRLRFSRLVYVVAAVHFVILAQGAKYTYAEEPLFEWLRAALDLNRNHFDRLGHFAQGFTPALITREVLLRRTTLERGALVTLLSIAMPLAFSAMYELLEWIWVLLFYPDQGPEWLGMQGDPWDAQWDMLMALCGAVTALASLAWLQNRELSVELAHPRLKSPAGT